MALPNQIDAAARVAKRPVAMKVFDNELLDTITDATDAQWATFTVDVITTARRDEMPREELLRVLSMLGITEHRPARRGADGKAVPRRGVCSGCHTRQSLMLDGRVASHKRGGEYCSGRYHAPVVKALAVAS